MAWTQKNGIIKLNLLPNERREGLWDALWFGIRPFSCLITERLIVEVTLILKVKSQNLICYRMNVATICRRLLRIGQIVDKSISAWYFSSCRRLLDDLPPTFAGGGGEGDGAGGGAGAKEEAGGEGGEESALAFTAGVLAFCVFRSQAGIARGNRI